MRTRTLLTLAATAALAGCGGGASGTNTPSAPSSPGTVPTAAQISEQSVSAANALGNSVKNMTEAEKGVSPLSNVSVIASRTAGASGPSCNNGFIFLVPDSSGDPDSTEAQYFYDSSCTQLARDVVRIFTPAASTATPAAETVSVTETQYAIGNATPIATRSEKVMLTAPAATDFDKNGFPSVAAGFQRTSVDSLTLQGGTKTIASDHELVMQPAATAVSNSYCSDSADYNMTGIPSLSETFGGQGGVSGGSRTVNSDGSVTWSATHAGTSFKGPIGSLSISVGSSPNTTCPIAAPLYTLSGGTAIGNFSIPVNATYMHGRLTGLTVSNAQLANGNTLSITTSGSPSMPNFNGTVANGGTTVATFVVDAFGDGTLTVSKNGAQYVIQDWHVVH